VRREAGGHVHETQHRARHGGPDPGAVAATIDLEAHRGGLLGVDGIVSDNLDTLILVAKRNGLR
jgi:hypothetical protein